MEARGRVQLVPERLIRWSMWGHQVTTPTWLRRRQMRERRGWGGAIANRRQPENKVTGELAAMRVGWRRRRWKTREGRRTVRLEQLISADLVSRDVEMVVRRRLQRE